MINPHYFIEERLKKGFKIYLEGQNIIHANSISTITPIYPGVGIETRYFKKILKEMATIYASLINQCRFQKNIIFFSASFYKINEEDQRSDGIELFINLSINHNLTETDINNIDV